MSAGDGGLEARLRTALRGALTDRDAVASAALRSALAAVDNARAVPGSSAPQPDSEVVAGAVVGLGAAEVPRRELDEQALEAVVRGEAAEHDAAALEYERRGDAVTARGLRAQAAVLVALLRPPAG